MHDLRTENAIIPLNCATLFNKNSQKSAVFEPTYEPVNKPDKHIIHKAIEWQKMLDNGEATSLAEIARMEGLTRARVTQIMNLLKLPGAVQRFLLSLNDPKEVSQHSERRLRSALNRTG